MAQTLHSVAMRGVLHGSHGIAKLGCGVLTPLSGVALLPMRLKFAHRRSALKGVKQHAPPNSDFRRVCCSLNEAPSTTSPVYQGIYGPWSVEAEDVREVLSYRAGLVTTAAAFVIAASSAFLPDDLPLRKLIQGAYDPLYAVGTGGLGVSLLLIHIYVTPIKRMLQLLWAVGVLGSIVLATNFAAAADQGLVAFVVDNPEGVWAVGPLFAALTGLAFKEGLCYGKFEAGALFFVIPSLLLGHLSGSMDDKVKLGLLGAWIVLLTVFASRKFTQPIKDDIGDKSVFIFQALPEEEKRILALKLQEQNIKNREED